MADQVTVDDHGTESSYNSRLRDDNELSIHPADFLNFPTNVGEPVRPRSDSDASRDSIETQVGGGTTLGSACEDQYIVGQHDLASWDPNAMYTSGRRPDLTPADMAMLDRYISDQAVLGTQQNAIPAFGDTQTGARTSNDVPHEFIAGNNAFGAIGTPGRSGNSAYGAIGTPGRSGNSAYGAIGTPARIGNNVYGANGTAARGDNNAYGAASAPASDGNNAYSVIGNRARETRLYDDLGPSFALRAANLHALRQFEDDAKYISRQGFVTPAVTPSRADRNTRELQRTEDQKEYGSQQDFTTPARGVNHDDYAFRQGLDTPDRRADYNDYAFSEGFVTPANSVEADAAAARHGFATPARNSGSSTSARSFQRTQPIESPTPGSWRSNAMGSGNLSGSNPRYSHRSSPSDWRTPWPARSDGRIAPASGGRGSNSYRRMSAVHAASQRSATAGQQSRAVSGPSIVGVHESPIPNNQLVRTGPPQTPEELVALITSGTWDLTAEHETPSRAARNRPGRTIASAFRHFSSGGGQEDRYNGHYEQPESVIAQRERDADHLANINRRVPSPAWFQDVLQRNLTPSVDRILESMPLQDPSDGIIAPAYGVVRIVEPPYHITKAEILSCLGRCAQIKAQPVGTPYYAIQIIMDRNTGKTEDVFVEVSCHEEARTIAEHFARRHREGRALTLGRRDAHIELSSMEDMMKAIFPFAKFVSWNGSTPIVDSTPRQYVLGQMAASFDGFIGHDECALMIKWLIEPGRSPFTARGPNRLYENVIMLLHKYPVHATDVILLKDRKRLFDITFQAVKSLHTILTEEEVPAAARLDMRLLKELVIAALSFLLFSDAQKAAIVHELRGEQLYPLIYNHGMPVQLGGIHEYASCWPFLAMVRKSGVDDNFVKYYTKLIRQQSLESMAGMNAGEISALAAALQGQHADEPFLAYRVDYGVPAEELENMSYAACVVKETEALVDILSSAVGG